MGKKIYRWGILGAGNIAQKFATDLKLLPDAELYAIGSESLQRAEDFAYQFGAAKAYGSYEKFAEDPDIDIVYVASRHIRHYSNSILCLNHGKAVLCEKPVAMNLAQCKLMLETARKNNRFFMEALWTRFIPSFKKCLELINQGAIGEVKLIDSDFSMQIPYDVDGRLLNPMLGGGSLLDIGIYPAFLALEIAGKPVSIKSYAKIGPTNVDETCSMIFQHSNGIVSVLYSSFLVNGRTESMIMGSKGRIRINTMWHIPTSLDLFKNGKEPVHFDFKEEGSGYQYEAEEVMKCLDSGKIQSEIFTWQKSIDLISVLDEIRKQTGIVYPGEVEKV